VFLNSECGEDVASGAKFEVSEKEYNKVLDEPESYYMPDFKIKLKLQKPDPLIKTRTGDIFKHADFW
jgi:hypothetical protein